MSMQYIIIAYYLITITIIYMQYAIEPNKTAMMKRRQCVYMHVCNSYMYNINSLTI